MTYTLGGDHDGRATATMNKTKTVGAGFTVQPLDESTWPAFADLVERDGGIWGGCWCIAFPLGSYL